MILKIDSPRQAVMSSYNRPILYKNVVILNGQVIIKFV